MDCLSALIELLIYTLESRWSDPSIGIYSDWCMLCCISSSHEEFRIVRFLQNESDNLENLSSDESDDEPETSRNLILGWYTYVSFLD